MYTELHFETIAQVTPTDVTQAKRQILKVEREEFLRHLVNHSEVWQKKIEAWDRQQWELANERYLDEIGSSDFQLRVEETLKREGISRTDEDAIRVVQRKMADDGLFLIRFPLTVAFLTEHNALPLLDGLNP